MIAGTRQNVIGGSSYTKDPLYAFGKAFTEAAQDILTVENFDLFSEPTRALRSKGIKTALKNFFCENFVDEDNKTLTAQDIESLKEETEAIFENDVQGIIKESAAMSEYSPMVGMALPIHKLILMNNVFSQGDVIQRVVAVAPSFTISLERRLIVTPNGDEIDIFLEQNRIADAIDATVPTMEFDLSLPHKEADTDFIGALGGVTGDELSTTTKITGVFVKNVYFAEGDHLPVDGWYSNKGPIATAADAGTQDVWFHVEGQFTPGYGGPGRDERVLNLPITIKYKDSATTVAVLKDKIFATMTNNKIGITSLNGDITKVKLAAKLNSSTANMDFVSVKWKVDSDYVEIPEATPINTTISPEEVKDIAAMYDANQVTKVMSITKTVLSENKDMKIKRVLDDSYAAMDERTSFAGEFDFCPPEGYALDWVTFRHNTFMDYIDDYATKMLQVLNDPNMTISIVGDPRIVRKVTPKDYTYQAPASIGPVTLDYTQTVVNTSDKRVYNFVGSDKFRNTNELMVILNPRNTERICYRLYDYQLYISNEVRNSSNPALPAIHAFERFKTVAYQPVQGRITILNPSGTRA